MAFTEILSSIVTGGATGLLGAVISRVGDYKNKQLDIELQKLKFENEIELKHADARIIKLEWDSREKIAVTEADAKTFESDSKSFQIALSNEPKQYANPSKFTKAQNGLMAYLDFIRGLIRPCLTVYFCGIMTVLALQTAALIKLVPIPVEAAIIMHSKNIETISFLATTCILFWFGIQTRKQNK